MTNRHKFVTLDGLRGIAALAVVTRHAPAFFGSPGPFPESFLAVDFFFVLSGFVLAHAFGEKLRSEMTPLRFMAVRLIRLYPLYLLSLVIFFAIALTHISELDRPASVITLQFIVGLFFLPYPSGPAFPLNSPSWSLHFELVANLVFACIARFMNIVRLSGFVALAGIALIVAVTNHLLGFGDEQHWPMATGSDFSAYFAGLVRVTYLFFCGVLVFHIWKKTKKKIVVDPFLAVLPLAAILLFQTSENYRMAFELVACIVLFPAIVFLGANSTPTGLVARAFSTLGRVSYAVYVLEVSVYSMFYGLAQSLSGGQKLFHWSIGLVFMTILVLFGLWTTSRYDEPVRTFFTLRMRERQDHS